MHRRSLYKAIRTTTLWRLFVSFSLYISFVTTNMVAQSNKTREQVFHEARVRGDWRHIIDVPQDLLSQAFFTAFLLGKGKPKGRQHPPDEVIEAMQYLLDNWEKHFCVNGRPLAHVPWYAIFVMVVRAVPHAIDLVPAAVLLNTEKDNWITNERLVEVAVDGGYGPAIQYLFRDNPRYDIYASVATIAEVPFLTTDSTQYHYCGNFGVTA